MKSKEKIRIKDEEVICYKGRKITKKVKLSELIKKMRSKFSSEICLLPPGTKYYERIGNTELIVVEEKPQKRQIEWSGRKRYLAFPYLIFIITFNKGMPLEQMRVFYRNSPITSFNDDLFHTNLLNINYTGHICLGKIELRNDQSIVKKVELLREKFWGASFNVEIDDDFFVSIKIDERISSIEKWEENSKKDPSFMLTIPWKKTGKSVKDCMIDLDNSSDYFVRFDDMIDIIMQIPRVE